MGLETSEKLTKESMFKFSCYKGIKCFNKCCSDLTLFLTPYDLLRLKKALRIPSTDILRKYTKCHLGDRSGLPVVFLKMKEDKTCPFVTEEGCKIYPDRPSSCRLYPLARMRSEEEEYFYMVKEGHCDGFKEDKEWTIEDWCKDQGADEYNEMNDLFMKVLSSKLKSPKKELTDKELKMFYMACYNIDQFRQFISQTSFIDYFDVDENIAEKSDEELLKLGFDWLRFSLFREKTLKLRASE